MYLSLKFGTFRKSYSSNIIATHAPITLQTENLADGWRGDIKIIPFYENPNNYGMFKITFPVG